MNISFSTDNNYRPMYVAMSSILYSKHKDTAINFIILTTNDFKQEYKNEIFMLVRDFGNIDVEFIPVEDKFVGVTSEISHITVPTYYRLLLPNIINDDRCLYLDTDVIVRQDLWDLYNTDIDGYELAGVEAYFRKLLKVGSFERFLHEFDIISMDKYINCGVMLMNLSLLRKNNFYEQGLKMFYKCHEKGIRICEDQDIINAICLEKIKILKPKYNAMLKYYKYPYSVFRDFCTKSDWEETWDNPAIIHYAGEDKPWKLLSLPYSDEWWAHCYNSGMHQLFRHEILNDNVSEKIFFKYIFQNKTSAIDRINRAGKQVMIYGAGRRAKVLKSRVPKNVNIKCFVVKSMQDNPHEIEGIPVYTISALPYKDLPIVISLDNELQVEVIKDLWKSSIYNIIYDKFELLWS